MSFDTKTAPEQLSVYKNRFDLTSNPNKALQATLSQNSHFPLSRHSLKSATKDRNPPPPVTRTRTMSASEEGAADTVTELTAMPTFANKHDAKRDRRASELKLPADKNDHTSGERRNSTPQLHLSSLLPHAFRNPKHHHKTNAKDETNSTNIASNNNASALHSADMLTMKTDPPYSMKLPTTASINGLRFKTSNSSEQLSLNPNEDSISSSSFIFDENSSEPRSAELFIFESRTPLCVSELYHKQFFEYFHINYYGEFDYEGPFIASVRFVYNKTATTDNCEARAIIRTPLRNCEITETVNGTNENNILQILFNKAHLPPVRSYGTIGDPKANEKIYLFDKTNDERYNCKIGVLYHRTHQTNEYDMFSNDGLSNELQYFINEISERVNLRGFQKYRGDLDTKDDLHGDYSYYTQYENHEIMFNIAPIIPSTKANGQCIERKALIGNAFVCVVFQEPGTLFSPDFISGKVTQIYITVQPIINDEQLYYKIGIWRRNDITAVIDPPGGLYKDDKSFRNYFLTLLLNCINVAIESPNLRTRIFEQRQRLKYEALKKLNHLFSLGPIPDFATTELENVHNNLTEPRSNLRSESFSSNTTITTNDSASSNPPPPGRTSPVTKKKGFSMKLFGVFSNRSGSVSSSSTTTTNNDSIPVSPFQSSSQDGSMTLGRVIPALSKDALNKSRSIKSNQAPMLSTRPMNQQIPQSISIQPPTPAVNPLNPLISDNLTQNNLLNTAALDIVTRNRSNSSPEDTANTNKTQLYNVNKIDEEDQSVHSSNNEDDDEETSEDEKPTNNRPLIHTSTINS